MVIDFFCDVSHAHMEAILLDMAIAERTVTIVIENNHQFTLESIKREFPRENTHQPACPWKGEAHYYDVVVAGKESKNAAWTYPQPKEAAKEVTGVTAFWKRVEIID